MIQEKAQARRLMRQMYKDVWAYTIPKKEDLKIRKSSSSSLYGEITFGGLDKLLTYLKVTEKDVFFDLGSGVGKVVLQTAMTTEVKKTIGIELSASRFKAAKKVLEGAIKEKLVTRRKCEFKNEDILKADLSKATIIYSCSTAFPQTFMKKLAKKLAELKKPVRIVSLQEFPETPGLYLKDKLKLDMSWTRNTPVFIFSNKET